MTLIFKDIDQLDEIDQAMVIETDFEKLLGNQENNNIENNVKANEDISSRQKIQSFWPAEMGNSLEEIEEATFIKSIQLLKHEDLIDNYKDYINCAIFLKFYEGGAEIIRLMKKEEASVDEINLFYLEIELHKLGGKYNDALALTDDCLQGMAMSNEEKRTFLKLRLNLVRKLGIEDT